MDYKRGKDCIRGIIYMVERKACSSASLSHLLANGRNGGPFELDLYSVAKLGGNTIKFACYPETCHIKFSMPRVTLL